MKGKQIWKYLEQVNKFIRKNPSEFIILKFQKEEQPLNHSLKVFFFEKIEEMFKDIMITGQDVNTWFRIRTVTMGQIQKSKKNILILFRNEIFTNYDKRKPKSYGKIFNVIIHYIPGVYD
jgi:hypothetical protein